MIFSAYRKYKKYTNIAGSVLKNETEDIKKQVEDLSGYRWRTIVIFGLLTLGGGDTPDFIAVIAITFGSYFAYGWYRSRQKIKEAKKMLVTATKKIEDLDEITSYPVTTNQTSGYTFSMVKEVKQFSQGGEVYIDHFDYYPDMEGVARTADLKQAKKTEVKIKRLDFTKTIMTLGGMGSGKTEFFHSILNQRAFNRAIIHDVKGDFVQKWYNEETDYIFNPYDERGFVWNIWAEMDENEALIESFVNNLMNTHTEEKDFFTGSAKKVVINMFMQVHYMHQDATPQEKWRELNKLIKEYGEQGADDKTKSSIYQTMELIIDLFEFFEYQSGLEGVKQFSFSEFLSGNGTLFLLNNPSVSKKLNPLFTSFVGLLIEKLLSREDTKEDLSLLLLDEYLSLNFEKETRLKLLTQIRSKGGCTILGLQFMPKKDKEHEQLLDSSCYGTIIFKLNDNETIKHIIESMGEIEYISYQESENGGKASSFTKSTKNKKFLTTEHLQSMPQYTHLSLFLGEPIIYLGYTHLVELEAKYPNFIKADMKPFYEYKFGKSKPQMSKPVELEEIEKMQIEEDPSDENALDFDTPEEGYMIDRTGIEYDPIKTAELKKLYKPDERIEIVNGYFELFQKEATAEEIEAYIEKYDLEYISPLIFAQEDEDEE